MKKDIKNIWIRELRHIYGAGIIFFYYMKWPILIGLPILYFVLDYPSNDILNILWLFSFILAIKDFIKLIKV